MQKQTPKTNKKKKNWDILIGIENYNLKAY